MKISPFFKGIRRTILFRIKIEGEDIKLLNKLYWWLFTGKWPD